MPRSKSAIGKHSKNKGKAGEREVVALMKKHGLNARRGQQFRGGGDSPDIIHDMEGMHVEVKRREQLNFYEALAQTKADRKSDEQSVVFHRRNGKPWVVIMYADEFLDLMKEIYE